jgi:hypothetical protein
MSRTLISGTLICLTNGCKKEMEDDLSSCKEHRCQVKDRRGSLICREYSEDGSCEFCSKHRCAFFYPYDAQSNNQGSRCSREVRWTVANPRPVCENHVKPCKVCFEREREDEYSGICFSCRFRSADPKRDESYKPRPGDYGYQEPPADDDESDGFWS